MSACRRKLALILTVTLVAAVLAVTAGTSAAAPGDLDTTFDSDGVVPLGGNFSVADLAVAPDGGVVALAASTTPGLGGQAPDFTVLRFDETGAPDTSFGTGGMVSLTDPLNAAAFGVVPRSVTVAPDGRVLFAGDLEDFDSILWALTPAGTLDTSFGGGLGYIRPERLRWLLPRDPGDAQRRCPGGRHRDAGWHTHRGRAAL